jgi:hypothetical protein
VSDASNGEISRDPPVYSIRAPVDRRKQVGSPAKVFQGQLKEYRLSADLLSLIPSRIAVS